MNQSALMLTGFALAFAQLVPNANPQGCLGDDGFAAVPCCSPATENLPRLPPFRLEGIYACLRNCNLESRFPVRVSTAHIKVLCDYAVVPLSVTPTTPGGPGWSGGLLAKYSRTWLEPLGPGFPPRQVWRYLVSGDLTATAGQSPCPIPPHPAGFTTHFHGQLDYACETDSTGVQKYFLALSLHHLPGCISHNAFSAVPLVPPFAHPERSYHLVAPALGFALQPGPEPQGVTPDEAVRSTLYAPAYTCVGEGQITDGSLRTQTQNCVCVPVAVTPFQWSHQTLTGKVLCAGATDTYNSLPLTAPLPPLVTGFVSLPLGGWLATPAGTFPEGRDLVIHWGILDFRDACNPNDIPIHVVQGVSTSGVEGVLFGSPAVQPYKTFLDLQNMLDPSSLGGPTVPMWGALYISKLVWNINL